MDQPDGDGESGPQTYTFQTLDPPQAPTDLIASALFIRLEDIHPNHQGRKIRLTAQYVYLAFPAPDTEITHLQGPVLQPALLTLAPRGAPS